MPYQTIVYCEKIIEGIAPESVEAYHTGLGRLFKWLTTALAGRKLDITRRKIATRRAKEDRAEKIAKEEDRKTRRAEYLVETKAQWETDHQEDIEVYEKYAERERRRAAGEHVSDEEDEEDEEGEAKQAPQKPVFNEAEALKKFDERDENAVSVIPAEVVDDIDDDWPMTAEDEKTYIDQVLEQRAAQ